MPKLGCLTPDEQMDIATKHFIHDWSYISLKKHFKITTNQVRVSLAKYVNIKIAKQEREKLISANRADELIPTKKCSYLDLYVFDESVEVVGKRV